jgi:hypothetical protein
MSIEPELLEKLAYIVGIILGTIILGHVFHAEAAVGPLLLVEGLIMFWAWEQ